MKKFLTILCTLLLVVGLVGCQQQQPYKEKEITATQLQKKLDKKQSFVMIIVRDNCPYCEALQTYIKKTKKEHPNLVLYKLDTTDFGLSKISSDSKQLQSSTEDGKILLDMAPYFLYTPTLYVIEKEKPHMQALAMMKLPMKLVCGM